MSRWSKSARAGALAAVDRPVLPAAPDRAEASSEDRRRLEFGIQVDRSPLATVVLDLENRIIHWNQGAAGLFGWTAAEAIGRLAIELFSPEAGPRLYAAGRATIERGAWLGELCLRDRAGRPVRVEDHRTLVRDEQGRPQAQMSIIVAVGERRRMEEQVLRAQRLEHVGLMAAGVAHDLNDVLAPILFGVSALRERTADPADRAVLDAIVHRANRGAGLVRQILAVARGGHASAVPVDLRPVLQDIERWAGASFPPNIRCTAEIAGDLPRVCGHASQLYQALLNLCVNAREAMPEGGQLRLRAGVAADPADDPPGGHPGRARQVCIEVEDTGVGLAPEVRARLWEPFFTTKPGRAGAGLGLAVVRGIVHEHGGTVAVETSPGRGSRFTVRLPIAAEACP